MKLAISRASSLTTPSSGNGKENDEPHEIFRSHYLAAQTVDMLPPTDNGRIPITDQALSTAGQP